MQTRVLIALTTMEYIRKADFLPYFLGLEKPEGSLITTIHGQSPAKSRNLIIDQALEHNCTHIFFIDDDMAIPPDSLMRLLSHDKDVVTGLYLMRGYPHLPLLFNKSYDDGKCKHSFLTDLPSEGLVETKNCGFGSVLVKTHIFDYLDKPYVTLGEIEKDGWCDDIAFFNKARNAGFKMYCDLSVRIGHMTSMAVWPTYQNGQWFTEYKNENGNVLVPQMREEVSV